MLTLAAFLVVLIVVLRVAAPNLILAASEPFWRLGSALTGSAANASGVAKNSAALSEENDTLRADNQALNNRISALQAKLDDFAHLKGTQDATRATLAAGVLAGPPTSPYDTLIVSLGSEDGVDVGMRALAQGGVPIGRVDSVTAHTARVALFSETGRETSGWVGETRIPVTLLGTGTGTYAAVVPKDSQIQAGDQVYLPGPGAVPVGVVKEVDDDPSSPRRMLSITPFVNQFSLTWVEIDPES